MPTRATFESKPPCDEPMTSGIDVLVTRHRHTVLAQYHLLAVACNVRFDLDAEASRVMSADRFVDGNPRLRELIQSCTAGAVCLW